MPPQFDNSYARLPERFYSRVEPEASSAPSTVAVNAPLARRLGFDPEWLNTDDGAEFITGNRIIDGSEPIATVYAGHQFGNWVPRLGDGRAHLLGEVIDEDGERFDIQLKGSGRTPYSRRGDGKAPLGPVLREYLIAEAMAALDIPTTRALACATTGDPVHRDRPLPGGVLVRVAHSHIRVGTFEYFASQGDAEALQILVDYTAERHYPGLPEATPASLLDAAATRQAELIARWQLVGFIHGVMNTDNMLLSGETIDYGPCAFMNEYDPNTVYSSIDHRGRYAYGNQPAIARWNISRLAQALVAVFATEEEQRAFLEDAQEVIDDFPRRFRDAYTDGMAKKLGLESFDEDDFSLIEDLLELMVETTSDYTLTFRALTERADPDGADELDDLFSLDEAFDPWLERWRSRLDDIGADPELRHQSMTAQNPAFIPRNHLVEKALNDAVEDDDYDAFFELHQVLSHPFDYREDHRRFARPPAPEQKIEATFCGT